MGVLSSLKYDRDAVNIKRCFDSQVHNTDHPNNDSVIEEHDKNYNKRIKEDDNESSTVQHKTDIKTCSDSTVSIATEHESNMKTEDLDDNASDDGDASAEENDTNKMTFLESSDDENCDCSSEATIWAHFANKFSK